jgi:hypothetical protein
MWTRSVEERSICSYMNGCSRLFLSYGQITDTQRLYSQCIEILVEMRGL